MKGFIVQWGMNGDPKVNKDWSEITIKDDPPKVSATKSAQWCSPKPASPTRAPPRFSSISVITARPRPQGFTPFGEVIQGMDNVMNIYTGYGDGPPDGAGPDQAAIAESGNALSRRALSQARLHQDRQGCALPRARCQTASLRN